MGRSRLFLISCLMYDSLWTSSRFYKLPQNYYVMKVLIYSPVMDSQRLSTLHGLCAVQTYKYPYVFQVESNESTNYVSFTEVFVYKDFYQTSFNYLAPRFEPSTSSELRLHYHLSRAGCALSTISIVWTLPPVSCTHTVSWKLQIRPLRMDFLHSCVILFPPWYISLECV